VSVKVTLQVELPDSMVKDFFQHVRDFEQRAPDQIHVQQWMDAPDMKLDEAMKAMEVYPPMAFKKVMKGNSA
jgi:hypothetical protein